MFTPQGRRGSPPQSRQPLLRTMARDNGKRGSPTNISSSMAAGGDEALALVEPPTIMSAGRNGGEGAPSESDIWKRFQDEGALDMPSLERKDRAALHARIAALESEVIFILKPFALFSCM